MSTHDNLLPHDYEERRRRTRRWKSFAAVLIALTALGLLAGAVVIGGQQVFGRLGGGPDDYSGAGTGSVTVVVPKGAVAGKIGQVLEEADVVKSASAFVEAARGNPKSKSIQPGTYELKKQMSGKAALAALLDKKSRVQNTIAVPEGATSRQVFAAITKATKIPVKELQAAARSGKIGLPRYAGGNVEGFLFPATYDFEPGDTAVDILKAMVAEYNKAAKKLDLEAEAKKLGLEPLEVVTLASMIERETRIPGERAKVSRVIHNRLDIGMRLQIDATIQYLLPKPKKALSTADLEIESPYNTYTHKGLPPGPIASPRAASLQAALEPAEGNWLYYVVTDPAKGVHTFTDDYDEFINLKNKAKRDG